MATLDFADSTDPQASGTGLPHRRWRAHPRPGIDFPDINTVAEDAAVIQRAVSDLTGALHDDVTIVAGIDLGGAALAGAVAGARGLGFIHIRKVGSLRTDIVRSVVASHDIGHGLALTKGLKISDRRIALIDDCLLSGATVLASARLLRELGALCDQALFTFEIEGLGGRSALAQAGIAAYAVATVPPQEPVPA
jgi:adenine phosphoribosyltransferase